MWPMFTKYKKGDPVSKINASDIGTAFEILNNIEGVNCEIEKTATGKTESPWRIIVPQGSSSEMPPVSASVEYDIIASTGPATPPIWKSILLLLLQALGVTAGDADKVLTVNSSGNGWELTDGGGDELPEGVAGDILVHSQTGWVVVNKNGTEGGWVQVAVGPGVAMQWKYIGLANPTSAYQVKQTGSGGANDGLWDRIKNNHISAGGVVKYKVLQSDGANAVWDYLRAV